MLLTYGLEVEMTTRCCSTKRISKYNFHAAKPSFFTKYPVLLNACAKSRFSTSFHQRIFLRSLGRTSAYPRITFESFPSGRRSWGKNPGTMSTSRLMWCQVHEARTQGTTALESGFGLLRVVSRAPGLEVKSSQLARFHSRKHLHPKRIIPIGRPCPCSYYVPQLHLRSS